MQTAVIELAFIDIIFGIGSDAALVFGLYIIYYILKGIWSEKDFVLGIVVAGAIMIVVWVFICFAVVIGGGYIASLIKSIFQ